jgi:broad specificity phosphatase PhoE
MTNRPPAGARGTLVSLASQLASVIVADPLILVRHARPLVSPDQVPGSWPLSEDGLVDSRRLRFPVRDIAGAAGADVVTIVSSTEQKAVETAGVLGLGTVHTDERLCEVARPWYEDKRSFREAVHQFLTGALTPGWESFDDAAARFDSAVVDLAGPAVVVSHGTVMSAWLGLRIPGFDSVSFWEQLRMPDAWLVDLSAQSVVRLASEAAS